MGFVSRPLLREQSRPVQPQRRLSSAASASRACEWSTGSSRRRSPSSSRRGCPVLPRSPLSTTTVANADGCEPSAALRRPPRDRAHCDTCSSSALTRGGRLGPRSARAGRLCYGCVPRLCGACVGLSPLSRAICAALVSWVLLRRRVEACARVPGISAAPPRCRFSCGPCRAEMAPPRSVSARSAQRPRCVMISWTLARRPACVAWPCGVVVPGCVPAGTASPGAPDQSCRGPPPPPDRSRTACASPRCAVGLRPAGAAPRSRHVGAPASGPRTSRLESRRQAQPGP